MKKIIFALCIISLLLFAGCSKDTAPEPKQIEPVVNTDLEPESTVESTTDIKVETPEPVKVEPASTGIPDLSTELIEGIKNELKGHLKVIVRPGSINANPEEIVGLGLGIYNSNVKDAYYVVKNFYFVRAVDSSNNVIDTDEKVMMDWLLNKFTYFPIDSYKSEVLPLHFKVKDIKEGVAVKPGTYEFNLKVFTNFDEDNLKRDFGLDEYGQVSIFIKVS
ncbi:MAG: hypothetical protein U9R08_07115 [Nanoarchaeota archaeon]|nr:hypothetical protein [Nanoarchaeota archaeon]